MIITIYFYIYDTLCTFTISFFFLLMVYIYIYTDKFVCFIHVNLKPTLYTFT